MVVLTNVRLGGRLAVPKISDGSIIKLRVVKLAQGRVFLNGPSLRVVARNAAGLRIGELVTFWVARSAGKVVLHLLQREAGAPQADRQVVPPSLISSLNLPDTVAVRTVLAALIASRRTISAEFVRKALQRYNQRRGTPPDRNDRVVARWAVELADRGLMPETADSSPSDPALVDQMIQWFAGLSEQHQDRSRQNDPIMTLKDFCRRRSLTVTHPVQVYNALRPVDGDLHWVIIPIRATFPSSGSGILSAVLKIGVDPRQSTPLRALLSVESPRSDGRWWFYWNLQHRPRVVKAGCEGKVEEPPQELLAALGVSGHTEGVSKSDGLSVLQEQADFGRMEQYG